MVKSPSLDPDALLEALKAGQFYSSQGPRLHDVEISPSEIRVECSPVDSIAVLTGTSRAITRVGRDITHATFDLAGALEKSWVKTQPDKWFRIAAIDHGGRRAWTNPIWVDALG